MNESINITSTERKRPWLACWGTAMSNKITLFFRTDQKLCRTLETIACKKNKHVSQLIEDILKEHVEKHQETSVHTEKRRYDRKRVSASVFLKNLESSSEEPMCGRVLDMSLGGLCMSLPQGNTSNSENGVNSRFETTIMLPETGKAVTMLCEPQWSLKSSGSVHMGASFVAGDFAQYKELQQFLMQ